ncbi:MAG: diguanylate cyclase [Lachnospiraceae bacterium]|nr:diguanylate cyclase [Lachnospiraceae bacterium]
MEKHKERSDGSTAMRIGFASTDGISVNEHFGHAKYWEIYELNKEAEFVETRMVRAGCSCHDPGVFDEMLSLLSDCSALVVSRIGEGAAAYVTGKGKRVFEAAGYIEQLAEILYEKLAEENN